LSVLPLCDGPAVETASGEIIAFNGRPWSTSHTETAQQAEQKIETIEDL
jgi:hypothetical protein